MAHLTIEFQNITDLRLTIAKYHNELKAENLDPNDRAAIESLPITFVRMPIWLRQGLTDARIQTLGQLSNYTAVDFLALPGLGDKSLEVVNEILTGYNLPAMQ